MNIDKDVVKQLRIDIEQALKVIEKQYDMDITLGKAIYDIDEVVFNKVKFTVKFTEDGRTGAEAAYGKVCGRYNLDIDSYNKIFLCEEKRYQIKQINTRNVKFPIIVTEMLTGKSYKFGADRVRYLLGIDTKVGLRVVKL